MQRWDSSSDAMLCVEMRWIVRFCVEMRWDCNVLRRNVRLRNALQ